MCLLGQLDKSLSGAEQALAMLTAHFQIVLAKGQRHANTITELIEVMVGAKRHLIPSEAYADVYEELSAKNIIETAKHLARDATSGGKQPDGRS